MVDGLVGEIGQNARKIAEEENKQGQGPAPILLQHMVETTVWVALRIPGSVMRVHVQ